AAHLENCMRENGSEGPSFTTIMASGIRGVLPHGIATDKVIAEGEFLTMDYGAIYAGYDSDITRTICIGHADEKQRRIYGAVLESQKLALTKIKPGVSGKSVHMAVQDNLARYDLKQYFGHGLGHSLGLEIHENPRMSLKRDDILQENMLITDEPGVYIPGWGGLRIEDTVLVTKDGCEPLTKADKELIEVI
ncbi:MAG: M24 family metallopeptidase, partial [Selenomonas sp.]|nr:M24 family metallopeptidase [Selenomonas sp.]